MRYGLMAVAAILWFSCAWPGAASAQGPEVVRIIWDMGRGDGEIYWIRMPLAASSGAWQFPQRTAYGVAPGGWNTFDLDSHRPFLRPGDRVVVYVTNYNPVSHAPVKASVVTVEPELPGLIAVLNNLVAVFGGGIAKATTAVDKAAEVAAGATEVAVADATCGSFGRLEDCLRALATATSDLRVRVAALEAYDGMLRGLGEASTRFPGEAWNVYDNASASEQLTRRLDAAVRSSATDQESTVNSPLPSDYTAFLTQYRGAIRGFRDGLTELDELLGTLGLLYRANPTGIEQDDRLRVEKILELSDALRPVLDSRLAKIKEYSAIAARVRRYRHTFSREHEAEFVIEVPVTAEAASGATIVVDQPLRATSPESRQTDHRFLSLTVEHASPVTFPSVGLAYLPGGGFGFKKNALVQSAADTSVRTFDQVDDDTYRDLMSVLLTHFRIGPGPGYATLGTSVDKNIFQNILVGGSYFHPRSRIVITAGALAAKGAVEDDLVDIANQYTGEDGNALSGVNLGQIPDGRKWHWTFLISFGVKPF